MAGNGKLFRTSDVSYEFNEEEEKKNTADLIYIFNNINKNTPILYVQKPCKYNPETDILPYGYKITFSEKYDYWTKRMIDSGIPILDLRKCNPKCKKFYFGDHHWKIASSYNSAIEILKTLRDEYGNKYYFKWDFKGVKKLYNQIKRPKRS